MKYPMAFNHRMASHESLSMFCRLKRLELHVKLKPMRKEFERSLKNRICLSKRFGLLFYPFSWSVRFLSYALILSLYIKREEQIRKEMERHDHERRKEEERLLREKQREEERYQREQRCELERREKFLMKESIRVSLELIVLSIQTLAYGWVLGHNYFSLYTQAERMRKKEKLRKEKEEARLNAANERAIARKLAKESMELIEDELLELMELAASSKGLPSTLSLDFEILIYLEVGYFWIPLFAYSAIF